MTDQPIDPRMANSMMEGLEAEGASADMLHDALERAGAPLDRPTQETVYHGQRPMGGAPPLRPLSSERPTQADLAKVTDLRDAREAEQHWDDPAQLEIDVHLYRAWALELERKGASVSMAGPDDLKALRMAQAAIRFVPRRPLGLR